MGPGGVKSPGSRGAKSWAGGRRGRPGLLERVLLLVMIRFRVWMVEMGQDRWRRVMEEFRYRKDQLRGCEPSVSCDRSAAGETRQRADATLASSLVRSVRCQGRGELVFRAEGGEGSQST